MDFRRAIIHGMSRRRKNDSTVKYTDLPRFIVERTDSNIEEFKTIKSRTPMQVSEMGERHVIFRASMYQFGKMVIEVWGPVVESPFKKSPPKKSPPKKIVIDVSADVGAVVGAVVGADVDDDVSPGLSADSDDEETDGVDEAKDEAKVSNIYIYQICHYRLIFVLFV